MRKGDPVRLRGVNVGHVNGFRLVDGGVELALQIENRYRIPADSKVSVAASGLLGQMTATLEPGRSAEMAGDGSSLEAQPAGPATSNVEQLAGQAGSALEQVQSLLSPETVEHVHQGSAELAATLSELQRLVAEQRRSLSTLSGSLGRSARGVEQATAGPELGRIVGRLDAMTERLDAASVALGRSAQSARSILGRVEEGQGALGRLARDDTLYENANRAITSVERAATEFANLAEDVRKHPKRYVDLSLF
jgi:phospholipid/cholesterol/gamma-HCH transport system substrate-binding protein